MEEKYQMLVDAIHREAALGLEFTRIARESVLNGAFEIGTKSLQKAEEHHSYVMWLISRLVELEQPSREADGLCRMPLQI
jgi:hypothetical protein